MKHAYLIFLAAYFLTTSCKKEKENIIPYLPYETPAEKALGDNFSLIGRWKITPAVMQEGYGQAADRYTFRADSTYGKLYLGDIGESGTYKTIASSGTSAVTLLLERVRGADGYHLLIEKRSYRHIVVNGINFFREEL